MAEMGPVPVEADVVKLKKEKYPQLKKNYLLIPEEYISLKQNITFKFQNMDFAEAMTMMAKIGGVNILVGDDVAELFLQS